MILSQRSSLLGSYTFSESTNQANRCASSVLVCLSPPGFLAGGSSATRAVHMCELKGTILTFTTLIIIFCKSKSSSLISSSLWEGQGNLQEISQFMSHTKEARKKPWFRRSKGFPLQLLEHEGYLFLPAFLQLWRANRVSEKHEVLPFILNAGEMWADQENYQRDLGRSYALPWEKRK